MMQKGKDMENDRYNNVDKYKEEQCIKKTHLITYIVLGIIILILLFYLLFWVLKNKVKK